MTTFTTEDHALDTALDIEFGNDYRGWTGATYRQKHGGEFIRRDLARVGVYALHHSASRTASAESVWRYHVRSKGWDTAGYHLAVAPGGQVEMLIPPSCIAYCVLDQNPRAVCVVALGDYTRDEPPAPMLDAIYRVFCTLDDVLGGEKWRAHREVLPGHTACPGNALTTHLAAMRGPRYGAADPRPDFYP